MPSIQRLVAATLVSALALTGCADRGQAPAPAPAGPAFPVDVTPPGGKPLTITKQPTRIVSLSPTHTESLFAIGAGKQVVAVDKQSNFPAEVPKTTLDGFQPNIEAIAGQTPDLVVASDDLGGLVDGLTKVKIPVLLLPSATTVDDSYAQISLLGKATGHAGEAEDVTRRMRDDIEKIVRDTPKPARELTYYHELDGELFSATSKTFIGQIYDRFGLVNIADSAGGTGNYPRLSAEKIVQADPDLVFLADTKCCHQNARSVAARPGWARLKAVRSGTVIELDDDIASRWGPRVVDLVRTVSGAVAKAAR